MKIKLDAGEIELDAADIDRNATEMKCKTLETNGDIAEAKFNRHAMMAASDFTVRPLSRWLRNNATSVRRTMLRGR